MKLAHGLISFQSTCKVMKKKTDFEFLVGQGYSNKNFGTQKMRGNLGKSDCTKILLLQLTDQTA